jgi:hypothetical protein
MATVSTPATLNSVKTVFGGPNNLRAYLRGGSYVKNFPNAYSTIATSGALTLSSFAGKINPTTALGNTNYNLSHTEISPTNSTVSFTVRSNGQITTVATGTNNGTWLLAGQAADYEIRYTKTSGVVSGGDSTNTWLNLATTRSWNVTETTNGYATEECGGTLEIRMASSPQTVLHSFSLSMEAIVEI